MAPKDKSTGEEFEEAVESIYDLEYGEDPEEEDDDEEIDE